jgi:MFS family permease
MSCRSSKVPEIIDKPDNRKRLFALSAIDVMPILNDVSAHNSNPARYRKGFWAIAFAFTVALGFTTVPAPLWSLYRQQDHFSSFTVTVVFAAYGMGVALSLFLAGHLSDWHGRRRLMVPALSLNLISGVIFLTSTGVAGLTIARVLSGLGVGAVTATATAWISELHAHERPGADSRRAEVVSTAANLGGLGLGAIVSGAIAQWGGSPLTLPYVVFIAAQLLALGFVFVAPETRSPADPRPRYRPQRVSVPRQSRARYFSAAGAAMFTFAALGLLTSLAPSFVSGTLHHTSHVLAGAVAGGAFIVAVVAQTATASRRPQQQLATAIPAIVLGLGLLTLAVWLPAPSLAVFIAGVIVIGFGAGLMFKGAVGTVAALASEENRAEALAGLFLAAYLGLAGPVIGLGVMLQYLSPRVSLLLFASALGAGIVSAAPALLGSPRARGRSRLKPEPVPD